MNQYNDLMSKGIKDWHQSSIQPNLICKTKYSKYTLHRTDWHDLIHPSPTSQKLTNLIFVKS